MTLPTQEGDRIALVIGINDYSELGKLATCRADAQELARVLVESAGYSLENVILLTAGGTDFRRSPPLGNIRAWVD